MSRLFVKLKRELLPQVKSKYPFIYLERGRINIDDSSVKWINSDGDVIRLPVACINAILLGPGTSVTHDAIKTIASANCSIFWVSEDSLSFYALGLSPTSNTRNMRKQAELSSIPENAERVARHLFRKRFNEDVESHSIAQLMAMEGYRVKSLYEKKAEEYGVGWSGRKFSPGNLTLSDTTNKSLTLLNSFLYGVTCSVVHSLGFSPHLGFIHSGSPLPFVYDISDLYKDDLTIDLAFRATKDMRSGFDINIIENIFKDEVMKKNIIEKMVKDINGILKI
jgi:CRISPR-associated protein Cas1